MRPAARKTPSELGEALPDRRDHFVEHARNDRCPGCECRRHERVHDRQRLVMTCRQLRGDLARRPGRIREVGSTHDGHGDVPCKNYAAQRDRGAVTRAMSKFTLKSIWLSELIGNSAFESPVLV